jgi:hypothetical protein
MIDEVLQFLSGELNKFLLEHCPIENSNESHVDFVELNPPELSFTSGAVNALLINIEEEQYLKPANPYIQTGEDGRSYQVSPPNRLNLYLLFAANFSEYSEAMKQISHVIQFFQRNPVFTALRFPAMPNDLEKLILELNTLEYNRLNEIWGMLKSAYLPSVVYKVKMVTYQEELVSPDTEISEINKRLQNR